MSKAMLKERHKDADEENKEQDDIPFKTRLMFPISKIPLNLLNSKNIDKDSPNLVCLK